MAGQAANSALPANGVGGLAFGAWALRRSGLGAERIARGTVAFFMLTSLGNILMLFVFGGALTLHLAGRDPAPALTLGFLGAGLAVIAGALALPPAMACLRGAARGRPGMVRHAVSRLLDAVTGGVTESIHVLRRRPLGVIGGTAGYLAFDIACLGVCFRAVGHPPPPTILMVGYLIGQMGGALPVPGGIGAVEGGLIGAFVVYGTPLPEATAAVLAYRVFSMCVPVLLGGHALMRLRRSMRAAQGGTALAAAAATAVGGHPGKP